jgi:hypothetical protein
MLRWNLQRSPHQPRIDPLVAENEVTPGISSQFSLEVEKRGTGADYPKIIARSPQIDLPDRLHSMLRNLHLLLRGDLERSLRAQMVVKDKISFQDESNCSHACTESLKAF